MSASLVGSEMCIRDRKPHHLVLARPDEGVGGVEDGQGGPPDEREPREAVSYTHLTLPTICSV
eukprot:9882235-Alexandrium_andersonii.AAC.1